MNGVQLKSSLAWAFLYKNCIFLSTKLNIFDSTNIGLRCSFFMQKYRYTERMVVEMYPYMNYGNYPQYQQTYQQPQVPVQYMDRLGQLQNMQQPQMMQQPVQRQIGINGAVVEDFGIITANDVPMDGNGAVFIKRDGSEIQIRNWTANGTIATSVFKPVKMEDMSKTSDNLPNGLEALYTTFEDKFNQLFNKIDKLEESMIEVTLKKE